MAVTFNATATAGRQTSVSSQTFSLAVAAGSDRHLLVAITHSGPFDGRTVSSVVFNGSESATFITGSGQTNGNVRVEQWQLDNPTQTTANVVVTMSGVTSVITSGAVVFNGASGVGTPTLASGTSDGNVGVTVTDAESGEMVIGVVGVDDATDPVTLTTVAGTQRWITAASGSQEAGGATRDAATPTLTWDIAAWDSSAQVWAASGVSVMAAAGGGTPAFGFSYGQRSIQRGLARGILRTPK